MQISTKGRYALRLMLDLAQHENMGPISIRDISKRQEISNKYLEQIMAILSSGGLVRSIRGSQGGYLLRRPPSEYTVGEIFRLTEGSLSSAPCVESDDECNRMERCASLYVYQRINKAISEVVDSITLEDLLNLANDIDDYVI